MCLPTFSCFDPALHQAILAWCEEVSQQGLEQQDLARSGLRKYWRIATQRMYHCIDRGPTTRDLYDANP